jgi:uncharacterized protein
MTRSHIAPLITASFILMLPISARSASFNCNTADRPDEVLICQQPQLSSLDDKMARLYSRMLNDLTGAERRSLQANQRAWLNRRFACGYDFGCIKKAYNQQIEWLVGE